MPAKAVLARLQAEPAPDGVEEKRRQRWRRQEASRNWCRPRVKKDKKFAEALLREGIDADAERDVETGKTILRDYIKATVGFEKLGEATGTQPRVSDPDVRSARQSAGQKPL